MRLIRLSVAVAAVMVVLVGPGCREVAIPPAGSYDEVLLVTEDGATSHWTDRLKPLITAEHDYVITTEPSFTLATMRASQLPDFPTVKNIVLCGTLSTTTDIGQRIIGLIGPSGTKQVHNGARILKKDNLPAPGQLTLIVTAPTEAELDKAIDKRGKEIPQIIEESCRERLRRNLLQHPATGLTKELQRKYGFTIRVPYLYVLFSDKLHPPGVELLRQPPARDLGIYWVDRAKPPTLYDSDELFDIRANYVWKRYDHDKMDRDKVTYTWTRLGPYDAIEMAGYWYNDKATAGGYFETYFIYDARAKLLWAVDLVVFAPGREKHPLVRELQALAETFRYQ